MSDSERYTIDEARIVSEIIDGEAIIVNLANGYYYSLDPPAAEIWGWLEAGWSIADIISMIQDRYDCSGADPETAVRALCTGLALAASLTRAFAHLASDPADEPSLTVYLADGGVVSLPRAPWEILDRTPSTAWDQEEGALMHVRDERVDGLFRLDGASVSMLDHVSGVGVFWTASPERVPRYERAAPLRALLDWWGGDHGCRVVHAGAVGTERGGALLVGKAGSGKSTAVLACLGSGLSYAGDDGVAVSHGPRPLIHSLYCTAKLQPGHLRRALPHLASVLEDSEEAHQGKRMFFLDRDRSAELTAGSVRSAAARSRRARRALSRYRVAVALPRVPPGPRGLRLQRMPPTT